MMVTKKDTPKYFDPTSRSASGAPYNVRGYADARGVFSVLGIWSGWLFTMNNIIERQAGHDS